MAKTAFIFPGQGAQYVGMAKDFYDGIDECRAVIDEADALMDFDLKKIMFDENDLINKTEYTQAAMLAAEICILKAVELKGIKADITAGLSLGEYAALVACGSLSFGDAMKLVRKRGIYMENEVPAGQGTMAAVIGLDAPTVERLCAEIEEKTGKPVSAANYNCPGQIVISGAKEAVGEAVAPLKEAGAKLVSMLNVSGPFHSPMLKGAGDKLAKELEGAEFAKPAIPYINNVAAETVTDSEHIKETLERQVYSPVRWQQTMEKMLADGVDTFYEIGPGKTLAGFMKRIDRSMKVITVNTVEDLEAHL
ncbi:MAG: ACP S-malonyltransferase [Butyrivibrio sp.]|nr:ACP S-malonyltransferase [Butyrivibrio sp.]